MADGHLADGHLTDGHLADHTMFKLFLISSDHFRSILKKISSVKCPSAKCPGANINLGSRMMGQGQCSLFKTLMSTIVVFFVPCSNSCSQKVILENHGHNTVQAAKNYLKITMLVNKIHTVR